MTGPMINPKKPKSLKPTNRAMSVANGSSPILDESTFGSMICLWTITTMYRMRRPMANAVSPVKNTYITQGTIGSSS